MTPRVSTPVGKKRRKKKPKAVAMKKTSTNSEKPTDGNPGNQSKPKRPSSSTSSFRLPSVTSLNKNNAKTKLSSESTSCDNTSEAGALLAQPADDETGEGSVCKGR